MERKEELVRLYGLAKDMAEAYLDGLFTDDDFKAVDEAVQRSIHTLWEMGS